MVENTNLLEKTGVISRQTAFQMASAHTKRALQVVIEIMENPRMNPNARLGAARTIIDKVLPDLKATEMSGELAVDLRNVLRLPSKRPLDTPPKTD